MEINDLKRRAYWFDTLIPEKKTIDEILAECPRQWGIKIYNEIPNKKRKKSYIAKQTVLPPGD